MEIMLSEEDWEWYEKKYGKLMHSISNKISGDAAVSTHEDNYADLCMAAIESIKGFHKKTGDTFSEMKINPLFNKYTKTCLWNHKNSKGKCITKKIPMLNKTFSTYSEKTESEYNEIEDLSVSAISIDCLKKDIKIKLNKEESKILDLLVESPDMLMGSGRINVSKISRTLGMKSYECKKILLSIGRVIKNELV